MTACAGDTLITYKTVRIIVLVHAMKAHASMSRGGIVALLKLSFTLRPLFRGSNSPSYPLNVGLDEPEIPSGCVRKIQSLSSDGNRTTIPQSCSR